MADLSAFRERMRQHWQSAGEEAARDMEFALKQAAPVAPENGGETRDATHVDLLSLAEPVLSWLAHSDTPQAGFTNTGTRAHGPVTAPFLVFKGFGGHIIRTKWVAGIEASHWFDDVVRDGWQPSLQGALDRAS